MKNNRKGSIALVVLVIAIIAIVGAVGYFIWKNTANQQAASTGNIPVPIQNLNNSTPTSTSQVLSPTSTAPTSRNDKYGLFLPLYGQPVQINDYANDGVVASGPYAGYHILIVEAGGIDPGYTDFIFATKDYQTFILDSNTDTGAGQELSQLFTPKVVSATPIPIAFPATISMGNFILVRESSIDFQPVPTGTAMLSSPISGLTIYGFASSNTNSTTSYMGPADVYVEDVSGIVFNYSFESQQEFLRTTSTWEFDYNRDVYESSDIQTQAPIYSSYGQLEFNACGEGAPYVLSVVPSGLQQIGATAGGVKFYAPTDSNSQLYKDEYFAKVTEYLNNGITSTYSADDSRLASPSYSDYISRDPVLVFQDTWGRWIGIGENDYMAFTYGCGKPVIYLYPIKPTQVRIGFGSIPKFGLDIPTYGPTGWDVLAQPDGELTDLQPQLTDCAAIDSTATGSEYAQDACEHNDYPYLYWEGQATNPYPTPTGGWIISQSQISSFLSSKLTEIGLTTKEENDMMSYWVPQLLQKNAPYYQISFFQTAQMNQFIPMWVIPKPDTTIRVFLDWSPLSAMPAIQPQPEALKHIDRQGFTVVEWGGLKQ